MNQETSANGTSTPYQAALQSVRKQSGPSEAIQLTLRKKTPSRNFPGAPVMSMTMQSSSKRSSINLGPGQYNVSKEIGRDAPKFSFGRKISKTKRSTERPGPGEYNPRESLSRDRVRSPVIKMGERFPQKRESQSPDPGNYHRD